MREIKFRAWDKQASVMLPDVMTGNNLVIYAIEPEEAKFEWDYMDRDVAVLMQYTGLKDCNGAEIYEGDIVLWPDQGEFSFTAVVKWDHHSYYMDIITWHDNASFDDQDGPELEVIGNIYENPELLRVPAT
jgi:uncharacterized phage protein (TIGR01671 family)